MLSVVRVALFKWKRKEAQCVAMKGFREGETMSWESEWGGESRRAMRHGMVPGIVRVMDTFAEMSLPRSGMGQVIMIRKA